MPHFEVDKNWKAPVAKTTSTKKYHIVVKGDVVSVITNKYGTTIAEIKSLYNLDSKYAIYIG